ncbi:hypothetical protein B0J13DRAFT_172816 [Dactylonectria estremocensis]|uniref:Uncharacterized protein n=1 Tax=Dactylonectria estremocensis TaxID=1079267 RepID=A0A9P9FBB3_9HYPO|nr:hypothetical protein B0J13DRAFT_172816 [Dactylonectria estremocensis]
MPCKQSENSAPHYQVYWTWGNTQTVRRRECKSGSVWSFESLRLSPSPSLLSCHGPTGVEACLAASPANPTWPGVFGHPKAICPIRTNLKQVVVMIIPRSARPNLLILRNRNRNSDSQEQEPFRPGPGVCTHSMSQLSQPSSSGGFGTLANPQPGNLDMPMKPATPNSSVNDVIVRHARSSCPLLAPRSLVLAISRSGRLAENARNHVYHLTPEVFCLKFPDQQSFQ